ncbi:MAG: J domain-containing protein [Oscillatoria sp. PMC 1051.18]|nr:J domain-containing protein [Oscillatoria sp. PMC 1050.18]MEC5032505.1 J domain-containing protein [Oscillatoria sp. PMC 1051.18]
MTTDRATEQSTSRKIPAHTKLANSYYALLGLHPSASAIEIRRSYRELSKRYHPDTTDLPTDLATAKFQQLNEAYATLSNPERRSLYDLKIGYSRFQVIQPPQDLNRDPDARDRHLSNSAYLDNSDRPLSEGEIFALFILGLTFIACLLLVIAIGLTRGEAALRIPHSTNRNLIHNQVTLFTPQYLPFVNKKKDKFNNPKPITNNFDCSQIYS